MQFEKQQRLDDLINIRLTKNEKIELKKLAKNANLTMTNYIKSAIERQEDYNTINKEYLSTILQIHKEIIDEKNIIKIKQSFLQLERYLLKIIKII